jgi:hypothetical protein
MSIDRRLREAFLAAGQETDGEIDVERHLQRAVARARPREVGRAVATAALVVALVAGVFAAGAFVEGARHVRQPLDGGPSSTAGPGAAATGLSTALDGTYGTTVRVADGLAAGLPRAEAYGLSGTMELVFARDSVRVVQQLQGLGQIRCSDRSRSRGRRLVVHQEGETVTLDWQRLPNGDLRFTIADDTRVGLERLADEVVWTSHPWRVIDR